MQVSREYLLDLDKKRTALEHEILEITNLLNENGGVEGRLVDDEGFPIEGLDIQMIRTQRNKLIYLQNDLKNLMTVIENNMQIFFKNETTKKAEIKVDKPEDKNEPISLMIHEEVKKEKVISKLPFAWIGLVAPGSPAEEAGLQVGDGIVLFGNLYYGASNNPLQKISEIVSKNIDQEIAVEIIRKNVENEEENIRFIKLNLIPHTWSGQGVLGCKLNLTEN